MANSDVFLRQDRVSVIGGDGSEVEDGRERGDLEVTVGKDAEPSVTLNADWANVTLGGGAGKATEGDVRLLQADGRERIKISADSDDGNVTGNDNTVSIDGGSGRITLAPTSRSAGTNTPTIALNGSDGMINLFDPTEEGTFDLDERVRLVAKSSEPNVQSQLLFHGGQEQGGVKLYTEEPVSESAQPAGALELYDRGGNKGIEMKADQASMRLGYSYVERQDFGDLGGRTVSRGVGGTLFLDDGNTLQDTLVQGAAAARIFQVRATEGKLEISTTNGGDPVFRINPSEKEIEIPGGWKLRSGGDTVLDS